MRFQEARGAKKAIVGLQRYTHTHTQVRARVRVHVLLLYNKLEKY